MAYMGSTWGLIRDRETSTNGQHIYTTYMKTKVSMIQSLGLETELRGHEDCVNCLGWNDDGSILASGSDDRKVILWDAFRHQKVHEQVTEHVGNIFCVKIMPRTGTTLVASGARKSVLVYDKHSNDCVLNYSFHKGRINGLEVCDDSPSVLWSVGDDGIIHQIDTRERPRFSPLLIVKHYMQADIQLKCMAVNPLRTHQIAVGCNDPYIRLFDRRYLRLGRIIGNEAYHARDTIRNPGMVQFLVPSHIDQQQQEADDKFHEFEAYTSSLSYSQTGHYLLANLGLEHLYLYDLNESSQKELVLPSVSDHVEPCETSENESVDPTSRSMDPTSSDGFVLPEIVETLKDAANRAFMNRKYSRAVSIYNMALTMHKAPQLYCNRAAAFNARLWAGDAYSALRDCMSALELQPNHVKSHYRLIENLLLLERVQDAKDVVELFKKKFPKHSKNRSFRHLEKWTGIPHGTEGPLARRRRLSRRQQMLDMGNEFGDNDEDLVRIALEAGNFVDPILDLEESDSDDSMHEFEIVAMPNRFLNGDMDDGDLLESDSDSDSSGTEAKFNNKYILGSGSDSYYQYLQDANRLWLKKCWDYSSRFCGHCNTGTEIKKATFFGDNDELVLCGSGDGSLYIWNRESTNVVNILKGDSDTVNCVLPHPSSCLIATSGIEPSIKLFSPLPDNAENTRVRRHFNKLSSQNQARMDAFMYNENMTFRL